MLTRLRAHLNYANLTYANVTATLAFALVLTALVAHPVTVDAAPAASGTWFLGGSENQTLTCGNCNFTLAATGVSTFGSINNGANNVLSPSVAVTASKFTVQIDTAPSSSQSLTFAVGVDPAHSLKCVISSGQKTCNSGAATATIPANSRVSMAISNSGGAPATLVKFSWLAVPQ
jgi:hypothetical protein